MSAKIFALGVGMLLISAQAGSNSTDNTFLASAKKITVNEAAPTQALSLTPDSASMEAAITDLLLGNSKFAATPMGGSVAEITKILTNTMMPKVVAAHNTDKNSLVKLHNDIKKCGSTKNTALVKAGASNRAYLSYSTHHGKCRGDEAAKSSALSQCRTEESSMKQIKKLKCDLFAAAARDFGTQKSNSAVVKKAGSEATETYIRRISSTFCGSHVHGTKGNLKRTGGWGGGLKNSILDKYLKAKAACSKATKDFTAKVKECKSKDTAYKAKKGKCDSYQTLMDTDSCKHAVGVKDACEAYAGCYSDKVKAYNSYVTRAKSEETDRKAEWRGLSRMSCLIKAFADGKVADGEVNTCKKMTVDTKHLRLSYPKAPNLAKCELPTLYPSTGPYLRREFASLPVLAKGKKSAECVGVEEISTYPAPGSPKNCKCARVTLNGPYSAGAIVKCTNCIDTRRSIDKNSCPQGTKLFAPASRTDWRTFLGSAKVLKAPHFIIDVTRPSNGCGGCTGSAMKSSVSAQKSWRTTDGAPWWLRDTKYGEPNGDYHANCYLGIGQTGSSVKEYQYYPVKYNVECKSKDIYMGKKSSAQACANAVGKRSKNNKFFVYGKRWPKKKRCYAEITSTGSCAQGFEKDKYDFFKIKTETTLQWKKITFNDGNCNYHSKSYYCQLARPNLKPKAGSPKSCKCQTVNLSGPYSAGGLVRCEHCLKVYRSTQKNSCPAGTKLFSPAKKADWTTVMNSGGVLQNPHFIVDITRPQNGCGGCTHSAMKSGVSQQASWRTSDGSAWWLRNSKTSEPNGDYHANCYLHVSRLDPNNMHFNDGSCGYHSSSYYCQPKRQR